MQKRGSLALDFDELLKTAMHDSVHHAKKSDEVRFAGSIRSNQDSDGAESEIIQLLDGAKASEAQCFK